MIVVLMLSPPNALFWRQNVSAAIGFGIQLRILSFPAIAASMSLPELLGVQSASMLLLVGNQACQVS